MPDFEFTSPQGKRYTITGPEGATPEQAFAILRRKIAQPDQAPEPLSAGAQARERIIAAADQTNRESGKAFIGPGEAALGMASGIGSSAVGGLKGLWDGAATLARGGSVDEAVAAGAKSSREIQDAGTYHPRTGAGKLITEIASLPLGIAKSAASEIGGDIGQAVNGAKGRIAGESIGDAAPDIAATLLGGGAAMRAAPGVGAAARRAVQPMRDAARITSEIQAADDAAALAGKPSTLPPRGAPAAPNAMQSAGAAVADHQSMAAAAGAAPEIQSIIASAGKDVHPTAAARHAEASSLPVRVDLTRGQATGDSGLISMEKNNRGKFPELAEIFDRQNGQLIENFDEIRQSVAPDVAARGVELGQMAVDAYKGMDAPVRADITAKYKALEDANGGAFPLSGVDFAAAADAALIKANRARFLPAEVRGILDDVRETGAMTFADFENYRTILAEQSRKADRAGDGTASYAIGAVRNALESLPMTGETAALKPLADAARNAARARFDRIKSDPAYKAAIGDGVPVGEPSPIADKFMQSYVVKGKAANVQNMIGNLGNDPINRQILSAGVLDHLKEVSGIDLRTNQGNVSQAGLNKAIKDLSLSGNGLEVLGRDAATTLDTLGSVAKYTMHQSKASFINNSNTAVAAAANGAKNLALGALDVKTLGATKFFRDMVEKRRLDRDVQRTIQLGAGINLADLPDRGVAYRAEQARVMQAEQSAASANAQNQSLLAERVAAERKQKLDGIANAGSVDEAVRALSDPPQP